MLMIWWLFATETPTQDIEVDIEVMQMPSARVPGDLFMLATAPQLETLPRANVSEKAPDPPLPQVTKLEPLAPALTQGEVKLEEPVATKRSKTVPWLVLLDRKIDRKTFQRHMISKYLDGGVAWSLMGVLAMPDAPRPLLEWAADLGVEILNVSTPIGSLHAWCMTQFERVVFTAANTVITRDVRRLVDICADEADVCGACAGFDLPMYNMDPGVLVARPSKEHCEALNALALDASTPLEASAEKKILNSYFPFKERKFVDARYNTIVNETKTIHQAEDAIVIQYIPRQPLGRRKRRFQQILDRTDRKVSLFEAERTGIVPRSVLYATLLTPAPNNTEPHSTKLDMFKQHHLSKFHYGKIPWRNQAVIYTEDAFPEYRAWLKCKGGKAISVPTLFCEAGLERYKYQFTKLQFWSLKDYDYVVYMDMDTYVMGDVRKLWAECPDGLSLCGVEQGQTLHKKHYINGGLLVARPGIENYEHLMEGLRSYNQTGKTLCEQDFLNKFLGVAGIGALDPTYNVMTFDRVRLPHLRDAKVIHFRWPEMHNRKLTTPDEREFMIQTKKALTLLIDKERRPHKASKTEAKATKK